MKFRLVESFINESIKSSNTPVDLNTEAKLVYEDADWEVWVPETYDAYCKLSQGTKWSMTDNYFNFQKEHYGGDYYININKYSSKEKYNFHFKAKEFMNIEDEPIDLQKFFDKNVNLQKFYAKKFNLSYLGVFSPEEKEKILNEGFIYTNDCTVPKWVTKVIVDKKVKKLPQYCFEDCTLLTTIDLNNVRTIENGCFSGCTALTSIDLTNVTELGYYCFENCTSLETLDLKNVTKLGEGCVDGCSSLKKLICHTKHQARRFMYDGIEDKIVLKN